MLNYIYITIIVATGILLGFLTEKFITFLKTTAAKRKAEDIINSAKDNSKIKEESYREHRREVESYREELKKNIKAMKIRVEKQQQRSQSLQQRLEKRVSIASDLKTEISELNDKFADRTGKIEKCRASHLEKLEAKADIDHEEILNNIEKELIDQTKLAAKKMQTNHERMVETNHDNIAREILSAAIPRVSLPSPASVSTAVLKFPDTDAYERFQKFYEERNEELVETINSDIRFEAEREVAIVENMEPVAKEIAYRTLNNIIQQKKFDFKLVKKGVERYQRQVKNEQLRAAKRALKRAGVEKHVPDEIVSLLGVLQFRTSFGQPQLLHSLEVSRLASLLAAELDADVELATRAGLLHDIGKAVDRQRESGHALIGAEIATEAGEDEVIVNSIGSHHNDIEAVAVESLIVAAADAISGSRPGARQENVTNYSERIDNLRKLAENRRGIQKVYIMNAGRELRIWVKHNQISDDKLPELAHEIASDIEENLVYSGEIRVNTIRRTHFTRTAHT